MNCWIVKLQINETYSFSSSLDFVGIHSRPLFSVSNIYFNWCIRNLWTWKVDYMFWLQNRIRTTEQVDPQSVNNVDLSRNNCHSFTYVTIQGLIDLHVGKIFILGLGIKQEMLVCKETVWLFMLFSIQSYHKLFV